MGFSFASGSDATNARGWCVSSLLEIGLPTASADVGSSPATGIHLTMSSRLRCALPSGGIPQVYNESTLTRPHSEFCWRVHVSVVRQLMR